MDDPGVLESVYGEALGDLKEVNICNELWSFRLLLLVVAYCVVDVLWAGNDGDNSAAVEEGC